MSCPFKSRDEHPSLFDTLVPFSGMWDLLNMWMSHNSLRRVGVKYDLSSSIEWENKSWISFLENYGKWIIHPKQNKTTTLLLRAKPDICQSSLHTFLTKMSHLRVLDLSYSSLDALPTSMANLTNLRLFSLKGCQKIRTLRLSELDSSPSPIEALERLEVLDLNGVPLTEVPEEIGRGKHNLYFLDLSCPTIKSLPCNLFAGMSVLRELSLLGCNSLESLPLSLATLFHLEMFSISETQLDSFPCCIFEQMQLLRVLKLIRNRRLKELPNSLYKVSKLQELHIHNCTALKEVNMAGHVSLTSFSLSKSPHIVCISLYACKALETIVLSDLNNLRELDLSFTSIKEFPLEVCNQGCLRRLDLISVPQLNRVPWHKLSQPLPEVFNFVQQRYEVTGN